MGALLVEPARSRAHHSHGCGRRFDTSTAHHTQEHGEGRRFGPVSTHHTEPTATFESRFKMQVAHLVWEQACSPSLDAQRWV
jgi:hypothetical protein